MTTEIEESNVSLGATIRGIKLNALSEKDWIEVHEAFLKYAVLIFPEQHLTQEEQEEFSTRFGKIENLVDNLKTIPLTNKAPSGEIYEPDSEWMRLLRGNEGWHTDSSYMPLTAKASILSARIVPITGGETEWADMRAGYAALNASTQKKIKHLSAYHSYFHSQAKIGHTVKLGAGYGFNDSDAPLHPLIKIHPETKIPALFIGRHVHIIQGLSEKKTAECMAKLIDITCKKGTTLRHIWKPGDLVVWDNRCVLHRALPYPSQEERLMLHTRVAGDPRSERAINHAIIVKEASLKPCAEKFSD
ncbi:MAG: TauD/TfdA dioxygenase family protein [Gammaproteobacteria bacterium]